MHTQTQARAVLVNYYYIAPRWCRSREDRLEWAAEQFARLHPAFSRSKAYALVEDATRL